MTDPAPDAPSLPGAPGLRRAAGPDGAAAGAGDAGFEPDAPPPWEALEPHEDGFLAAVCHQVRTPLNGILGSLELLLDADISDEAHLLATAAFEAALDLHRVFESQIDAVVRPA